MRRISFYIPVLTLLLPVAGCGPEWLSPDDGAIGTVVDWGSGGSSSVPAAVPAPSNLSQNPSTMVSGTVRGSGDYELFDLGSGVAGDEFTVSLQGTRSTSSALVVVLFDEDYDLLMRTRVSSRCPLQHIARLDTSRVYLGVMPSYGSAGGGFEYTVSLETGVPVPAPRQQVVYLNFGPGHDVRVHSRSPISFSAFDAAMLGETYVGHTQVVKDTIVQIMHEDYAAFDVVILSSDDGPPPANVAYATVHFGGSDSGLLGLADSVDMYNQVLQQDAMVYVESFAPYEVMRLEPDEMGVMIGNVASHELGHLLGLYHTKVPDEIMDCTGSAWDLAGSQSFKRAPLEDTVFATGMENTPRLLEQTVGLCPEPAQTSSKLLSTAKRLRYKEIRDFTNGELRCRCGNCINPDD